MAINITLKVLLEKRACTQTELSNATGIRFPTISAICNNSVKALSISVLERICDYLDCQPSDFLENITPMDIDKRRMIMSRKYEVPVTTKEERQEQVENALAMSGLGEKKLTPFMISSYEQYIEGNITQEEMMNQAIRKFNQEYEEKAYEVTLKKEVLLEYAAEVLSEFRRYFIRNNIDEMKVVNNEVAEKYKEIILLRNDIATSKYKTLEDLKEVEFKLKESKNYIDDKE